MFRDVVTAVGLSAVIGALCAAAVIALSFGWVAVLIVPCVAAVTARAAVTWAARAGDIAWRLNTPG